MSGTSAEWKESNLVQDLVAKKLLKAYTGTTKAGEEYTRYFETNPASLQAFQQRKTAGMGLSTRVWNLSEQYKTELEMAVSAAIEPGTSAMELAADIKKYLNEPDMMFRRFRYKDENGEWKRKWKQKVMGGDGKVHFIDADPREYHPGRGVYRSSARNAQRLARTEINMSYRTAEQERWRQFDFVVGYEVKTTQNGRHVEDICDCLAGKYRKDFKFLGWHPMCMCYSIPILKTEDEFFDDDEDAPSVNEVDDVPQGFKDWIRDNEERIDKAAERGTLPYFIRDNQGEVDRILHPEKEVGESKKTPQEIAAERHAARTPNDVERIQSDWNNSRMNALRDMASRIGMDTNSDFSELMRLLEDDNALSEFKAFKVDYKLAKEMLDKVVTDETALAKAFMSDPANARNMAAFAKAMGINQGDLMTFHEADILRGNPNYATDKIYRVNCQTAVVANELRRRGFDVQALGNTKGSLLEKLSRNTNHIWRDMDGNIPEQMLIGAKREPLFKSRPDLDMWKLEKTVSNRKQLIQQLESSITEDGRYHIEWSWNTQSKKCIPGHIITLERIDGKIRYYDPQNGRVIADFYNYTNNIMLKRGIKVLRVDDKRIDVDWAGKILEKTGGKAKSGVISTEGITGLIDKGRSKSKIKDIQNRWNERKKRLAKESGLQSSLTVNPERRAAASVNKRESMKFEKEYRMASTYSRFGHKVEMLEEVPGISSPDALIDGVKVDFKSLASANNIERHAKDAIFKQGADEVWFEFTDFNDAINQKLIIAVR